MYPFTLEVCVDTLESALAAVAGGATRLELCANLVIGGTTPSTRLLEQIRAHSDIPVRAMLRPRFGDFCYSDSEFDIMEAELAAFRELGANGVVFGILLPDGTLDLPRMERLRRAAGSMAVTLHRAFDVAWDPLETLRQARNVGVDCVLTSGQRATAWEGRALLAELVRESGGVEILAGSGVNADLLPQLCRETGGRAYHLSGGVAEDSPMVFRRTEVHMGLPSLSEFERRTTSAAAIAAARAALEAAPEPGGI